MQKKIKIHNPRQPDKLPFFVHPLISAVHKYFKIRSELSASEYQLKSAHQ